MIHLAGLFKEIRHKVLRNPSEMDWAADTCLKEECANGNS